MLHTGCLEQRPSNSNIDLVVCTAVCGLGENDPWRLARLRFRAQNSPLSSPCIALQWLCSLVFIMSRRAVVAFLACVVAMSMLAPHSALAKPTKTQQAREAWNAARYGQVERLQKLLEQRPDLLNTQESGSGQTLLMAATLAGQPDVVKHLLRAGADATIGEMQGYGDTWPRPCSATLPCTAPHRCVASTVVQVHCLSRRRVSGPAARGQGAHRSGARPAARTRGRVPGHPPCVLGQRTPARGRRARARGRRRRAARCQGPARRDAADACEAAQQPEHGAAARGLRCSWQATTRERAVGSAFALHRAVVTNSMLV